MPDGADVAGVAPNRPWGCPELVDCANIELAKGAVVDVDANSEDCPGCVVWEDEMSNTDFRFVGCSAPVFNPRLENNPPPPPPPPPEEV